MTDEIQVKGSFELAGEFPPQTRKGIVCAVGSVPKPVFFDANRRPVTSEVKEVDCIIGKYLQADGWKVLRDYALINESESRFNVDMACPDQKLLIEVEKGTQPRLELDLWKIVAACQALPDRWRYGALIVPATHIRLSLAGRQTPYDYLHRLRRLAKPVLEKLTGGILVVGYEDPRGDSG